MKQDIYKCMGKTLCIINTSFASNLKQNKKYGCGTVLSHQ